MGAACELSECCGSIVLQWGSSAGLSCVEAAQGQCEDSVGGAFLCLSDKSKFLDCQAEHEFSEPAEPP